MKKINLKNLSDEILSKDELKKIIGGNGSYPEGYPITFHCICYIDDFEPYDSWYTCFSDSDVEDMYGQMEQGCTSYSCN